jgi:hypothetical protein
MPSRTARQTVTFLMPFSIAAANQELPAGNYLVETHEELIQGLSFRAYRRVATFLRIPQPSAPSAQLFSIPIDPDKLEAALARDIANHAATKERRSTNSVKGRAITYSEWRESGVGDAAVGKVSVARSSRLTWSG